jgi:hypothetical protein
VTLLAADGGTRFLNTERISASKAHTTVKVFQSLNAQPEGVDDIFKRDGIYHLRLRFPAEDKIVNIALHGVFTYADALKTFRLFCGWLNARTT